jgi:hypothetical protein
MQHKIGWDISEFMDRSPASALVLSMFHFAHFLEMPVSPWFRYQFAKIMKRAIIINPTRPIHPAMHHAALEFEHVMQFRWWSTR